MLIDTTHWLNLAVALGIGMLIGAERERSNDTGGESTIAGVRTFTITSLLGAVSITINFWLLIASMICTTIFVVTSYYSRKNDEPGLTTEISLIFTVILGGLAMTSASMAASLAVAVAILLVAKKPIHGFVRGVVTKDEMIDFLILAAATLIILPLVPNALIGPFDAINPRNLWLMMILVMLIGALGHLALRLLGSRTGLPLVGLLSGFISSIVTIGAMGERVKKEPALMGTAVAGATLSSLSTILQLTILLMAMHPPTLQALKVPLLFGGVSIAAYGLIVTLNSFHHRVPENNRPNRSFSVKTAVTLTLMIALVLVASAALKAWFGQAGLVFASSIAGLADVRASTISVASLAATAKITSANVAVPILVAISTNAVSKAIAALMTGGKTFFKKVTWGLILQISAIWLGWWLF